MRTPFPQPADDARDRALGLAELALERGRPDEAIRHVQQVLASAPSDGPAWLLATRAHIAAGRPAEAADSSARALALLPGATVALRLRALALAGVGDGPGARGAAEHAIQLAPLEAWNHGTLASVLIDTGGPARAARAAAAQAVALTPTSASLHVLNARVALTQDRTRDARTSVAKALGLDPTNASALRLQAILDASNATGRRMARALSTQADQLRTAPGAEPNVRTMGLIARSFFFRAAAIIVVGAVTALRAMSTNGGLAGARATAAVAAALVVLYLGYTLWRVDADVRGYLFDVMRAPRLVVATIALAIALVGLAGFAALGDRGEPVWLAAIAVGALGAYAFSRLERRRFLSTNGGRVASLAHYWLYAAVVFTIFTAFFAYATATSATSDDRRFNLGVTAVLGTGLAGSVVMWWRQRRR